MLSNDMSDPAAAPKAVCVKAQWGQLFASETPRAITSFWLRESCDYISVYTFVGRRRDAGLKVKTTSSPGTLTLSEPAHEGSHAQTAETKFG